MSVFEAAMMICFGASWPFSVLKSLRTKKVEGKSLAFMWLILVGYAAGIVHKFVNNTDWVTALYFANAALVGLDIVLYHRYLRRGAREVEA